jgi:hypothetical protein
MKVALTGASYLAHSVIASAQRCLNLVPEPMPEGQKEPGPMAAYPTPGLRLLSTIGTGPIRAVRQATNGAFYVVSGHEVYSVNTTTWAGTSLGTITAGLRHPVSMCDNTLDMVIVDGSANGWVVNLAGNTMAPLVDPTGSFVGADRVDYIDTFLIFNKPGTPQFYWTLPLSTAFDDLALDFANKAIYTDLLATLIVAKREIWLIGERSTEVWYDTGATDIGAGSSQFAPVQSVFVDHGTVAKYSVAGYDNGVFWLTRDRQGQGFVVMGAGYQTKRVSTYAIEAELAGYSRIDDAIGYCYQNSGHTFYVLTFPHADHTWVFDITTGLWHEWLWIDTNGNEHRHRSNAFWAVNDTLVVGDWQNGNLYAIDSKVQTDNGNPIKRARSFPHLVKDGHRLFYRQFVADMDLGNLQAPGQVITSTETIITWLPEIAQLTGVSVGGISSVTGGTFIDWERGYIYMVGQTGYQKYTTALETQTALVTVTVPTRFTFGGDIDSLSGDLILQTSTGLSNGIPVSKIDPTTFAVLDTFGIATSFPSYPTAVDAGQDLVCVVCNGVSFGFLKYTAFSGTVAGFRVDTMEHCGFIANIVSGSTNNRGCIIRGKSGDSTASVFLSWDAVTSPAPAVPLYRIDVAASATAYNPASWPATNPGITWTTVGTIPVASVDPAWAGFTVYSLGYDLADGNVLMLAGTATVADGYRVLKLNALTAAVIWNITIGTASADLGNSRIDGSLWIFRNAGFAAGPTDSYRIDTVTGTMTTQALSGVFADSDTQRQQFDSNTTMMFFGGTFNAGSAAPIPVDGTTTFSSGWAWMGGQTVRTIVTNTQQESHLISLRWSDDRGHSYGNPVTQAIGAVGEYRTSLQWQRLAYARDRVFELSWSVAMPTALQGCWVDVTPAQS